MKVCVAGAAGAFGMKHLEALDAIDGVSECIIMGIPIPLGTGFFKLLHMVHGSKPPSRGAPLLSRGPKVPL